MNKYLVIIINTYKLTVYKYTISDQSFLINNILFSIISFNYVKKTIL